MTLDYEEGGPCSFISAGWHADTRTCLNLSLLMEFWMLQKLTQGITLKKNSNILGNTLIGFHADNEIIGSIPLSCPCVQY